MIPSIKKKLKARMALMVWSMDKTMLSNISRYFNMGSRKRAYQTSWVRNMIVLGEVWEFYGKPPKEMENANDNNPKWEVNMFWSINPNFC